MKIYLLRHEDRTEDCTFYGPLTKNGIDNSKNLANILVNYNINKIYSSPFIRALQTIYPYSKENNHKINIEYGLEEINHEDIIPKKSAGISLPEYLAESFNYNPEYKTIIKPEHIAYPETEKDVEKRVKRLLRNIIEQHGGTDDNIILVTHQCVCNNVIKIGRKHKLEDEYAKGQLSLVFDNDWVYKKLN